MASAFEVPHVNVIVSYNGGFDVLSRGMSNILVSLQRAAVVLIALRAALLVITAYYCNNDILYGSIESSIARIHSILLY